MSFLSLSDFEINGEKYDQKSAEIHHAQHILFESLNDQQKDLATSRFRFAFATIRAFGSIDKRLQIIQEADKDQDRKWDKEKKVYIGIFVGLMALSLFVDFTLTDRLAIAIALGVYVLLVSQASVPLANRAFNKITSLEISRINLIRDAESVGVTPAVLERLQKCEDMLINHNSLITLQFEDLHSIVCYQIRMEIMKDILNGKIDPKLEQYTLNPQVNLN
jgi:hypothetical protein